MPDGHPLNKIEPMRENISALQNQPNRIEAKIDRLTNLIDKVGQLTHANWLILEDAKKQVERPGIIVPGRS